MRLTAGATLAGTVPSALSQMPAPEPLNDNRVAMVTTTEAAAWKQGQIYKPTFQWELLNLNIDPSRTIGSPMEGFGGCFNELG